MKKLWAAVLLAAVLLVCAASALADGYKVDDQVSIPDKIQELLKKEKLSGYTATSCVETSGFAFVLMQESKGKSLLYVYKQKNKGWAFQFKTEKAIPQGKGRIRVVDQGLSEIAIAEENDSGEYWVKNAYYLLEKDGTWHLRHYYNHSRDMRVDIADNRIGYYRGLDLDEFQGSVYGTIPSDMRYVNLSTIPATLKEARNKYTLAPSLPGGTLSAEVIKFTGGKRYAVYSGPGEDYLRSAGGKAAVSTNDWIQVFGRDYDWIMIQYAIDASHYRIGYISAKALPKKAEVQPLHFTGTDAWTVRETTVTDDPLFSQAVLVSLPEGTRVKRLATLGEWDYIEWFKTDGSQMARGFVPSEDLPAMTSPEAREAAMEILLTMNLDEELRPATREMLENSKMTYDYDPMMSQWTVGFETGDDYRYTVVVNDRTGAGTVGSPNG